MATVGSHSPAEWMGTLRSRGESTLSRSHCEFISEPELDPSSPSCRGQAGLDAGLAAPDTGTSMQDPQRGPTSQNLPVAEPWLQVGSCPPVSS